MGGNWITRGRGMLPRREAKRLSSLSLGLGLALGLDVTFLTQMLPTYAMQSAFSRLVNAPAEPMRSISTQPQVFHYSLRKQTILAALYGD